MSSARNAFDPTLPASNMNNGVIVFRSMFQENGFLPSSKLRYSRT